VHQNLLFGVGVILTLLILGGRGLLKTEIGAALHTLAAIFVIFNSARLVRFGEELHEVPESEVPEIRGRLETVRA